MTAASPSAPSTHSDRAARPRLAVVSFAMAQPVASVGLVILVILAVTAICAHWLAPYDPVSISYSDLFVAPSWEHPMGTDQFGRDIFSRVIYGARTALTIGLISSLLGCTIGALVGVVSAYFGGVTDIVIQRLVDIMLAFPIIVLALVAVSALGHHFIGKVDLSLLVAIALPAIPNVSRVVRAAALSVVALPYVDAARAMGFSHLRIILRHVVPNVTAPYLVLLTAYMGQAILLESTLSYLGLGVAEPTPAWGLMLSGSASEAFTEAPWQIIFPGVAISITIFAFSIFGDGLRDWLDPKFRT